ncbi:hypothetical protein CPB83DRAFT_879627 [Crepidotus variabilis]|uniref:Uncharacterized protein n=1 Tax=Crepidotus variabilis TaxID=179855 RepID=A0A9P6ETC8_9AGAR|nr:hypothetical protein CPB83DRAFT_879627 [Crepidotus variabilis]
MFTAISASQSSKNPFNPFRTNPATPNPTGTQTDGPAEVSNSPKPSTTAPERAASPPIVSVTPSPPIPQQEAFPSDLFEDPPPYTPSPSRVAGETTIEQGPARPFQPPPSRSGNAPSPTGWSRVQNNVLPNHTGSSNVSWSSGRPGGSSRGGSLFQQIASSINTVIQELNSPQSTGSSTLNPQMTGHNTWSSYPGQQRAQQSYNWTPQQGPSVHSHGPSQPARPLSAAASHSDFRAPGGLPPPETTHRRHSSEFTRDFYAAGASGEASLHAEGSGEHAPPLPPRQSTGSSSATPRDGKPTSNPVAGHPLMNMGRVLVYPRGHRCEKCQNIGYKGADPNRPCNRCWNKYAKPFTGPVALSFSNTSDVQGESNLQRPLPYQPPSTPRPSGPPGLISHSSYSGPSGGYQRPPPQQWGTQQPGGNNLNSSAPHAPSRPPLPPRAIPSFGNRAPPGAIVYTAGDPRIGGQLCWRCNGKGNVSFLFDRITCDVCNGLGRLL